MGKMWSTKKFAAMTSPQQTCLLTRILNFAVIITKVTLNALPLSLLPRCCCSVCAFFYLSDYLCLPLPVCFPFFPSALSPTPRSHKSQAPTGLMHSVSNQLTLHIYVARVPTVLLHWHSGKIWRVSACDLHSGLLLLQ